MQGRRLSEDQKRKLREMLERESTRQVSQRQKKLQTSRLALAALICSVLPFAPFLCLPVLVPAIGIAFLIVILSLMFFPFHAPLLGILGTSLAITSIKREQRGRKLALAAIALGLLAIGIGLYTLRLLIMGRWWDMLLDKWFFT